MDPLKTPIYLYVAVKECIHRTEIFKNHAMLLLPASLILTAVCTPLVLALFAVLALVRYIVELILKQVHKENFVRMLDGLETLFCSYYNCTSNLLVYAEFGGEIEELKSLVTQQLQNAMLTKHEKMFHFRDNFLGYHYYFKTEVRVEDYVVVMENRFECDTCLSTQEFLDSFREYSNSPLPKNNRGMFQIFICPKPLYLKQFSDKKNIYMIAYKIHHSLCDGKRMMHLFQGVLSDRIKSINLATEQNINKVVQVNRSQTFPTDSRIKHFPLLVKDRNALRKPLLNVKNWIWFSDTDGKHLAKVKFIRKSMSGSFLDVINTCLSSSLHDYYEKIGVDIPDSVVAGVVFSPETTSYSEYGSMDFDLTNKFSGTAIYLPIGATSKTNQLVDRFEFIQKQNEGIKASIDVQLNYWITQTFMCLIPSPLLAWFLERVECTVGISSLPGCDKFTMFNGCPVQDFVVLIPNSPGVAINMFVTTYDSKLRISFTIDKCIMPDYKDAEELMRRLVENLDAFYELCSKNVL